MTFVAPDTSAPFADVFTAENGALLGYRLGGHIAGPRVLVVGHDPIAAPVFDRLMALPTLGWLYGELTLINLTALDTAKESRRFAEFILPKPDELMFLPYNLRTREERKTCDAGYWSVLRLCTDLGMISGRGVPRSIAA